MTDWNVEQLTTADYDAICAVWIAAGLSVRVNGRDSRAEFERQMSGGTQTVVGVRDGALLVGVVIATHDGRKGWINRLAVRPEYRRKGIGRRLVNEAENVLKSQGMRIIAALIEDWNKASLGLFEQAGYLDYPNLHYVSKRDSQDV